MGLEQKLSTQNIPNSALNFSEMILDSASLFGRRIVREPRFRAEQSEREDYFAMLGNIGKLAGIHGVMFYPFGGADVHTAFSLSENLTDVVSQGADFFGNPDGIKTEMEYAEPEIDFDAGYWYYDSTQLLGKYQHGIGSLVAARIVSYLRGEITGLYYFDIAKNGSAEFITEKTPYNRLAALNELNAVVEFQLPDGIKRRFWHITYIHPSKIMLSRFSDKNSESYMNFANNLDFDVLLLKAAHTWWEDFLQIEKLYNNTLAPAKRDNAVVITDTNQGDISYDTSSNLRPIWRHGFAPDSILIPEYFPDVSQPFFGYGNKVFYGRGEYLMNREELPL